MFMSPTGAGLAKGKYCLTSLFLFTVMFIDSSVLQCANTLYPNRSYVGKTKTNLVPRGSR